MPKQMTKNEFRRYLEKSGVVDVLEEMLVALYDEPNKPSNAMDFMRSYIGVNSDDTEKAAAIAENAELKKENEALKEKLNTAEAPAVDAAQTAAKDAPESAALGADATQPEPEPGPESECYPPANSANFSEVVSPSGDSVSEVLQRLHALSESS